MNHDITLQEGLDLFYSGYEGHLSHNKEGISPEAIAFFRSHDIAHVLFGCDISLFGEGAVKLWTIFGTNLGFWNQIKAYKIASAYELSKDFTLQDVLGSGLKLFLSFPIVIIRARQMSKPWRWTDFDNYLDQPISKIRKQYNIKVVT